MSDRGSRFLAVYAGLLTVAFAAVVLMGASAPGKRAVFEQIDVQRINLREPDGTLRMVVASRDRFPGAIFGDREYTHPRPVAGMIFLNDEGIENGGLIFAGRRGGQGGAESGGHLSFDPYDRDQAIALSQIEEDGVVRAGLSINDTGDGSVQDLFRQIERIKALPGDEQEAAMQALGESGLKRRLFVGKSQDQVSVVSLADAQGRARLRLQVSPDGQAQIEFLDADGTVSARLTPESLAAQTP